MSSVDREPPQEGGEGGEGKVARREGEDHEFGHKSHTTQDEKTETKRFTDLSGRSKNETIKRQRRLVSEDDEEEESADESSSNGEGSSTSLSMDSSRGSNSTSEQPRQAQSKRSTPKSGSYWWVPSAPSGFVINGASAVTMFCENCDTLYNVPISKMSKFSCNCCGSLGKDKNQKELTSEIDSKGPDEQDPPELNPEDPFDCDPECLQWMTRVSTTIPDDPTHKAGECNDAAIEDSNGLFQTVDARQMAYDSLLDVDYPMGWSGSHKGIDYVNGLIDDRIDLYRRSSIKHSETGGTSRVGIIAEVIALLKERGGCLKEIRGDKWQTVSDRVARCAVARLFFDRSQQRLLNDSASLLPAHDTKQESLPSEIEISDIDNELSKNDDQIQLPPAAETGSTATSDNPAASVGSKEGASVAEIVGLAKKKQEGLGKKHAVVASDDWSDDAKPYSEKTVHELYRLCMEAKPNERGVMNPDGWKHVRSYLLQSPDLVEIACRIPNQDKMLPIHQVCKHKPPADIIELFISCGGLDQITRRDKFRMLPIHLACIYSASDAAIGTLVQLYPTSTDIQDSTGATPLHYAVANMDSSEELIECLATEHAAKATDQLGMLPLHYPVVVKLCAKPSIIRQLIVANPRGLSQSDLKGRIPVRWLAKFCHVPEVLDLLQFSIAIDPALAKGDMGLMLLKDLAKCAERPGKSPCTQSFLDVLIANNPEPTEAYTQALKSLPRWMNKKGEPHNHKSKSFFRGLKKR